MTMERKEKVLHLTLKKKWFDMIASGEKKEEYREIKTFWIKRLRNYGNADTESVLNNFKTNGNDPLHYKNFTHVHFARGGHFHESIKKITLECNGIQIGHGNPDWGAEPGKEYFVIKLGEIIKTPSTP